VSREFNSETLHNIYIYIYIYKSWSLNIGLPTFQHLNSKAMFARLEGKGGEGV